MRALAVLMSAALLTGVTTAVTTPSATANESTSNENQPHVWSELYPPGEYPNDNGGIGVSGVFVFSAGLVNAVEFSYRLNDGPTSTVPADAEGKASVGIAPAVGGWNTLFVANKGASGEQSAPTEYRFVVDDKPVVTSSEGAVVEVGSEVTFSFAPKAPGVTAYEWRIDDGPYARVEADADSRATVKWRATGTETHNSSLHVRSISGDAPPTMDRQLLMLIDMVAPTVTISGQTKVGLTAELNFRTDMRDPVSYTYWTDEDPTPRTVSANPDRRARVKWTPAAGGWHWVRVFATNDVGISTAVGRGDMFAAE